MHVQQTEKLPRYRYRTCTLLHSLSINKDYVASSYLQAVCSDRLALARGSADTVRECQVASDDITAYTADLQRSNVNTLTGTCLPGKENTLTITEYRLPNCLRLPDWFLGSSDHFFTISPSAI